MKKISGLVLMALISAAISGCTLFQNPSTTANPPRNTTAGGPQPVITTTVTTSITTPGTIPATVPLTTAVSTDPSTTTATIAPPTTTTPKTKPPATKPPATNPPATKPPATKPPATKPPATKPLATKPPSTQAPTVSSNLPKSIKAELDKPENGIVLIYQPLKYPDIVAVTGWNVVKFETNSQLFLVTKKKGSLVQVYDTKLTADEQDTVIDDVIRDWTTTADYEVIRIRHSDPEIMLMNYIKVTEPGGKKTLTEIKSSMVGLPVWEAIEYD